MDNLVSVSPEDGFFKKLIAFNKMAILTIKSNKITGLKAIIIRLSVIIDSFSLFMVLRNQKRMMTASMYGLTRIIKIQMRLNENGVAYTFPIPEPEAQPNPKPEHKHDKEYLKNILSRIDSSKLPKN